MDSFKVVLFFLLCQLALVELVDRFCVLFVVLCKKFPIYNRELFPLSDLMIFGTVFMQIYFAMIWNVCSSLIAA